MFIVASAGTFSHYCLSKAISLADITIVTPLDFLRVPLPREAVGPDGTVTDPQLRATLGAALTALAEHARG